MPFVPALRPLIFHDEVFALLVSETPHTLSKCLDQVRFERGRGIPEISNRYSSLGRLRGDAKGARTGRQERKRTRPCGVPWLPPRSVVGGVNEFNRLTLWTRGRQTECSFVSKRVPRKLLRGIVRTSRSDSLRPYESAARLARVVVDVLAVYYMALPAVVAAGTSSNRPVLTS
jgi:hypothetical protein